MNTQQDELNRVLEKIREIVEKSAGGDYIYRGEPEEYKGPPYHGKISSSLYREYPHVEGELFDIVRAQNAILEEAKAYTAKTDPVEILSELQHFGGKTNLIDFTADYLIALFFACDGAHEKCGRVILLEKESEDYVVRRPPKTINRVESQKSVFVQSPKGFIEPEDVVIVSIPVGLKLPMLNHLQKYHNISTETIYNDLHGFIRIQDIHHRAYEAFYRGLSAADKGDFDKAIKDFTTTIELKPDFFGAYNNRGVAYFEKGDFDTAIDNYDKAIEIKPDYAIAYNNRGNAYFEKRDFDKAIQDLTTAIEIKPDYAKAYNNRGIAYVKKGDFDTAIQDFTTAIEINPRLAEAYCGRGEAWMHMSEWNKAKEDLTVAKTRGLDIIASFQNAYENVADFEQKNGVQVPADIKEMLTPE